MNPNVISLILIIVQVLAGDDSPRPVDENEGEHIVAEAFAKPTLENADTYSDIIRDLRNDWQSPVAYLEKRGYLPSDKQKRKAYKNLFYFPKANDKIKKSSDDESTTTEAPTTTTTTENVPTTTTTSAPHAEEGVVKKMKDKFLGIFGKSSLEDGFYDDSLEAGHFEGFKLDYDDLPQRALFVRSAPENKTSTAKPFAAIDTAELLKNLTESDVDYVKSFIQCFKENKNRFYVDYLHINASQVANKTETTTAMPSTTTTCAPPASTLKPPNATNASITVVETSKSPVNVSIGLNIDDKNATGVDGFATKLKFLAHLHHYVGDVGKPPYKPLDLNKIQSIIDKSRQLVGPPVVLGDASSTQCAPLQLSDMSIDLDWSEMGKDVGSKAWDLLEKNAKRSDGTNYKDLITFLKPPYADNFLDLSEETEDAVDKKSQKREISENRISKVLSDISSSLGRFNANKKSSDYDYDVDDAFAEDYQDDYYATRKRRKKKEKKRAKLKYGNSNNGAGLVKLDVSAQESMPQAPFDEDERDQAFKELNNIQFQVSADQEEAIATFINNLNTPPEIFNFDVDKYIRKASDIDNSMVEPRWEAPPKRTFYEFIDPQNPEKTAVSADLNKGKRDLLRQYIKGVSSQIRGQREFSDDGAAAPSNECKKCGQTDFDPLEPFDQPNRKDTLVQNYASNLDAMNYIKYKDADKDPDKFVDNYFLLNDGTYDIYKPQQLNTKDALQITPSDLKIDMDLEKKFRDLTIEAPRSDKNEEMRGEEEETARNGYLPNAKRSDEATGRLFI